MSERLLKLERRIAELEAQLRRPQIGSMPYVNTRPARAVAGPSAYPPSGNTFYIQFLDGSYSRNPGSNTPTYVARKAIATAMCHNIRNTLPPENTVLEVFEWRGYWWTDFSTSSPGSGSDEKQKFQLLYGQQVFWAQGDSSGPTTDEYMGQTGGGQWAPQITDTAKMLSDTIFTFDNTYDGAFVDGGQLICQIAGTYAFNVLLSGYAIPESMATTAESEYVEMQMGWSTNAGAGSSGTLNHLSVPCFPNDNYGSFAPFGKTLGHSTVGPIAVNDRVKLWYAPGHLPTSYPTWAPKPGSTRIHIYQIQDNTNTSVRLS